MKKFTTCLALLLAVLTCLTVLTACLPSDLDSAKKKMEDQEYTIQNLTVSGDRAEGLTGAFQAKGHNGTLRAYLYESRSAAQNAFDLLKENLPGENWIIKCKGKWVYCGSGEYVVRDFDDVNPSSGK